MPDSMACFGFSVNSMYSGDEMPSPKTLPKERVGLKFPTQTCVLRARIFSTRTLIWNSSRLEGRPLRCFFHPLGRERCRETATRSPSMAVFKRLGWMMISGMDSVSHPYSRATASPLSGMKRHFPDFKRLIRPVTRSWLTTFRAKRPFFRRTTEWSRSNSSMRMRRDDLSLPCKSSFRDNSDLLSGS